MGAVTVTFDPTETSVGNLKELFVLVFLALKSNVSNYQKVKKRVLVMCRSK